MKTFRILMIIITCLMLTGCSVAKNSNTENTTNDTNFTTQQLETGTKAVTEHRIQYSSYEFVSYEEKETWCEPLLAILSGMHPNGDYIKTNPDAADPEDRYTFIPGGYYISLFDLNADGIPEVLESYGGGTAGNNMMKVYDLMSGENIGYLDGGWDNSWCVYFNTDTGKYESVGQYSWRQGWAHTQRFIEKASLTTTKNSKKNTVYSEAYLISEHTVDMVEIPLTEEQIEAGITVAYDAVYPDTVYYVNGEKSSLEDYYNEYDLFYEKNIRIPETGIKLIDWDSSSSKDDDITVRATKMVESLLSSGQEFIKPVE